MFQCVPRFFKTRSFTSVLIFVHSWYSLIALSKFQIYEIKIIFKKNMGSGVREGQSPLPRIIKFKNTGWPEKRPELSHGVMQQSRWNESAEKHVCNEQTSLNMSMNFHLKRFHISHDTSEIVLQVIKQCLHVCNEHRNHQITTEIGFRRSWWLVKVVLWNGKFFSLTRKRLKSTRRLTLTIWRRPCC